MKLLFTTNLTVEDCVQRIIQASEKDTHINWIKTYFAQGGNTENKFFYKIKDNKFRIQKYRNYRNSFAPYFYGRLINKQQGTTIEGEFRIHPLVRMCMFIWFSGVIIIGGIIFLFSLIELFFPNKIQNFTGNPFIGIFTPFAFMAFGVGFIKFGQHMGRKEEKAVLEFIEKVCKAKRHRNPSIFDPQNP